MEHTRGIIEMYQRLVPKGSSSLEAVANRALAEIETAELQASRIAALEAENARLRVRLLSADGLIRGLANLVSDDGGRTFPERGLCELASAWLAAQEPA